MRTTSQEIKEFGIDLRDVVLNGTLESIEPMPVTIPKFQIVFDDENF